MIELSVGVESWPIRGSFAIARGSKTEAKVVVAQLRDGRVSGRGECVPYGRYGESIAGAVAALDSIAEAVAGGLGREELQSAMPAGAARNALDCAFWDLAAKRSGRRVWELAGISAPQPVITAYTLSLDTPRAMQAAAENAGRRLLKLKLAGEGDLLRVRAVRAGAPRAALIVDANEAWDIATYRHLAREFAALGVRVIEQPLPAGADDVLLGEPRPVALCADESCHDRASLPALRGRYDMVNIKLDKAGGLSEALALHQAAVAAGFEVMVGCMLATSLAMAPATLLTAGARIVDLDGPLLLAGDRRNPLIYRDDQIYPPSAALWG